MKNYPEEFDFHHKREFGNPRSSSKDANTAIRAVNTHPTPKYPSVPM
jgi:hypothetical protein